MKKQALHIGLALIALVLLASSVVGQDPGQIEILLREGAQRVILGDVLLDESFDSVDAWESAVWGDSSIGVIKGQYRVQNTVGDNMVVWGVNDQVHSDVVMQVDTTQLSQGDDNAYGLMCRLDRLDLTEGYEFRISGDGFYSIYAYYDEEYRPLVDWETTDVINVGKKKNTITVVCVDDYLALYTNGELLAEVHDTTFSSGVAGMMAVGFDNVSVDIAFDNLTIWEASSTGGPVRLSSDAPAILSNYDGDWQDVIVELREAGLIGSGGSLVFTEDQAFFEGQGNWFTPLARNQPFSDIVMAGELTFTASGAEFEQCIFTARIGMDNTNTAVTYVDVGLVSEGYVFILDQYPENRDANLEVSDLSVDMDEPHHILFILQDEVATVYMDGILAISGFDVGDRAGTYGISLVDAGAGARCDGQDIWVYQVPSYTPGVCEVRSSNNVNRRSGPGTGYQSPGQLTAGTIMEVTGQAPGDDGFTWWRLEDDSWVREDIVTIFGDCARIPVVEP